MATNPVNGITLGITDRRGTIHAATFNEAAGGWAYHAPAPGGGLAAAQLFGGLDRLLGSPAIPREVRHAFQELLEKSAS